MYAMLHGTLPVVHTVHVLSVTQCLSVYRTVPKHTATQGSSLTHNSLGCHPVCCWLVSRCLVLCCPTKKRIVPTLFATPFDGDWSSHSRKPSRVMHADQHLLCVAIPRFVQRVPPVPPIGQVMCVVSEWYCASLAQVSGQIKLCSQKPEFPRTSDVLYLS